METVHFVSFEEAAPGMTRAWEALSVRLRAILPDAEIHHVGSSTFPGARTKGDVDVNVRVPAEKFPDADRLLGEAFPRNLLSDHNDRYAAFELDVEGVPCGIQLCVMGSEYDGFLAFQAALLADPRLVAEYDALKARFHGESMAEYRKAKGAFVERVIGRGSGA